jgi:transketolase
MTKEELDQQAINTIRTLSHRCRPAGEVWPSRHADGLGACGLHDLEPVMRFDPRIRSGPNRDRFVLSNGHASMLLWSMLYPDAYPGGGMPTMSRLGKPSVTLDDIRHFRQLESKAPGHPEYHLVSGVETTDGAAWAGHRHQRRHGDRTQDGWPAVTTSRASSCSTTTSTPSAATAALMEGVGSEAASLAGHLGLDDLCWIYDNNHITIEGNTKLAFTEDVAARFLAYRWNVLRVGDANDSSGSRMRWKSSARPKAGRP